MAADPHHSDRRGAQPDPQADTQELARKLLDLWQDHLSALAQDPTLMAQALKLMAVYSPLPWVQPGAIPTGGTGFASSSNPFFAGFPFSPQSAAAAGPAPAAAAPDAGAGAVGELRRRVAELEGRLAELERGGRGGPAKPARKRAPGTGAGTAKGGAGKRR